ncbi:hypothetical protein [Burkholderia gladioli]|uniref:hypothetical protein n=1 Tax=Burkholderia gladioli TaxID=28095 RepID=UPI000F524ABB|nr:hypothetical protein [Burkholderia gladioli]
MTLQITILRYQFRHVPDSSMFFDAGVMRYAVSFLVTQGKLPSYEEMFERLACAIPDCRLESYKPERGEGILTTQNAFFPRDGEVIELPPPLERPPAWYRLESEDVGLEDFYDALNCHDWYGALYGDWRVAWRSKLHLERLSTVAARRGGDHEALLEAFRNHYYAGSRSSTQAREKPTRPVNGTLAHPTVPCAHDVSEQQAMPGQSANHQVRSEIAGASVALREADLDTHAEQDPVGWENQREAYEFQRRFVERARALASLEPKAKAWFFARQALADLIYPERGRLPPRQPGILGAWRTWSALTEARRRARQAVSEAERDLRETVWALTKQDRRSRSDGVQR